MKNTKWYVRRLDDQALELAYTLRLNWKLENLSHKIHEDDLKSVAGYLDVKVGILPYLFEVGENVFE